MTEEQYIKGKKLERRGGWSAVSSLILDLIE